MSERAHVGSIDAIKRFRSHLVNYVSKASVALDGAHDEVTRTRIWLEEDQRARWESEVRRRMRVLEDAKQTLLSAKLSGLRDSATLEQMVVNRALKALGEAEEKLARIRKWGKLYDSQVASLERGLCGLRSCLDLDMPKAVVSLGQAIDHLEAYRAISGSSSSAPQDMASLEEGGEE
jgi:hypothetical protein